MTRVSKKPEERRQELMDSAERLFVSRGYDNTSVSDIVKSLNVAQGTFYYHFKSKLDILEAVVEQKIFSLVSKLETITKEESADPISRLNNFFATLMRFGSANRRLHEPIHRNSNFMLHERLSQVTVSHASPMLARILRDGERTGRFDVIHPEETARLLLM
jgi:AcrR family transcriptional regulator